MSDYRIDWPATVLALPGPVFRLSGRVNRGQLWFRFGFLVPFLLGAFGFWWAGIPAGAILFYATFLAGTIALQIRRLHDLGHSGWWMVIGPLIAMVPAFGYWAISGGRPWSTGTLLFPTMVSLAFFAYLGFYPGNNGDNRFGPPPTTTG